MITAKEIIYIAAAAVLLLYSVGLTIALAVMSKRVKAANAELDTKIQKNGDDILATEQKLYAGMQAVDKQISDAAEATDRKIKDMSEELFAGASQLIEQKTADVVGRMTEINTRLNIMDSTVKNLEREKFFVQGVLLGSGEENAIEADYAELPEGFAANAKRAMANAAQKGKSIVTDYYPIIKKRAPGLAKAALKFVRKRRTQKNGNEE